MSAPTFTVTLTSQLTILETLSDGFISSSDNTVTINGLNETITLTAATTPAVTLGTAFAKALSGGAATIDLTALPGLTPSETIDGTGLKVQALKLSNPSTNANKIVVSQGASNAYRLDGATNWSIPLAPGASILLNAGGSGDAVGSTHKNLDLSGTGSQALSVAVALG